VPGGDAAAAPGSADAAAFGARKESGSARNFSRHLRAQKYQVFPACSSDPADDSGVTVIPQTGSMNGF
jgi:hypothetical protein